MNGPSVTGGSDLEPEQRADGVWKNSISCANCGRPFDEHCNVHLFRCCPGRCPAETAD